MVVWTHTEDLALSEAWSAGVSSKIIGETLGRTPGAVRNRAKSIGLKPRGVSGAAQEGWTPVKVLLPAELLPPLRQRGKVIREGLDLRKALRAAGFGGTPAELGAWLDRRGASQMAHQGLEVL